jgi:hypothetical protein
MITMSKHRKKAGAPYEDAVCDLFRQFSDASATIKAGVWVEGPDGRRELDVHIAEKHGSRTVRGVVECKDFNPATTGPVGIAYIDALDSKRRDLGLEFAIVCSNAGFTADAMRKAKRVNIGLLSATLKNDSRIRFGVADKIYMRHMRLAAAPLLHFWAADGESPPTKHMLESGDPYFDGRPVTPWLFRRIVQMICVNPIVTGSLVDNCRLKIPIRLDWPGGSAVVQKIGLEVSIEGAWFAQSVRLDSTAGFYDWLRRRMKLAPSPHPQQVEIAGIDYYGGKWIAQPPEVDWANRRLFPYETETKFVMWKNAFALDNPAFLDPHVVPEDLKFVIEELDESVTKSVPGFTSDRVPESEMRKTLWPQIAAEIPKRR